MASKWTAAFALLGVLVVFGAAGTLAIDASLTKTTTERTDSNEYSDPSPPALDTGRLVSVSLTQTVVYLAWAAVPLGILGILTIGGYALTKGPLSRSRGVHR